MALTTISGAATTASPVSNQLKVDMRDSIAMLDPDTSQFTTALMQLPKENAKSFKVEWLDDQLFPRKSALAASATSADVALTVTTNEGNYFNVNDLVRIVSTGEMVLVTATFASAFSATRAIGSVAAASAASGVDVVIVGNASSQAATLPTILMLQAVANYNYTQIQRNAYGFSRTATRTAWFGGDILDREREKKAVEHKRAIEQVLFYGARYYNATGPKHAAGGLIEFVTTNINSAAGTFDKAELQTFLRAGLQHGSKNKVLFASPLVMQVISTFLQDNWVRTGPDERIWGVKVDGVISAAYGGAEVPVFVKREWNDFSTGTSNDYGSRAFLVDMDCVQLAPFPGDFAVNLRNRQAPDYDGVKEEYLSEFSLKVERQENHALWTNVTG